jgi:putative DNA primase/helicase
MVPSGLMLATRKPSSRAARMIRRTCALVQIAGVVIFTRPFYRHCALFAATARHCYAVIDDPENERRLFVKAKNNLAPDTKALSYAVNALVVGKDERTGQDIWAPRVAWGLEHVEVTATEAMQAEAGGKSRSAAKDSAETFLRDLLANGDIEEAADANCISERTLFRAKADLGVVAKKGGMKGGWTWQLPDEQQHKSRDND